MQNNNNNQKAFINQLFSLIKVSMIHKANNQAFVGAQESFTKTLDTLLDDEGKVVLEFAEGLVFFNNERLNTDLSLFHAVSFLDAFLEKFGAGGIKIDDLPEPDVLAHFFQEMGSISQSYRDGEALSPVNNDLIQFIPKKQIVRREAVTKKTTKKRALQNYCIAMDLIKDAQANQDTAKPVNDRMAKRIIYDLVDVSLEEGFSIFGLASIKNYDEYTFNHSINVCVISIAFGKNLGLSKRQIGELGMAALFHDYGKLSIPKKILNKPGPFNQDEWKVMQSHPVRSVKKFLKQKGFQIQDIKKLIASFEHHRNFDSSGYPKTGLEKPMNIYSKIVAIADAYDAMTTQRVYQRAMLPTQALKILLEQSGKKFDPLLVKAFINTIGFYPIGSLVRLNTGEVGVVTDNHKRVELMGMPSVKPVANAAGEKLFTNEAIDLASPEAQQSGIHIEQVVHPDEYGINVAETLFGDVVNM